MEAKASKKKVSSYQKLKDKNKNLEFLLEMIITQPQLMATKNLRKQYRIDNDLE